MSQKINIRIISNNDKTKPNVKNSYIFKKGYSSAYTPSATADKDVISYSYQDIHWQDVMLAVNYWSSLISFKNPQQPVGVSSQRFFKSLDDVKSNNDNDYNSLVIFSFNNPPVDNTREEYNLDITSIVKENAHLYYKQNSNTSKNFLADPVYITIFDPYEKETSKPVEKTAKIVTQGKNFTVDKTTVTVNQDNDLTIKANDGYVITDYSIYQYDQNDNEHVLLTKDGLKSESETVTIKPTLEQDIYINVGTTLKETPYYNLPSIEHVTFTPNKAKLGEKTNISVKVDDGYTVSGSLFFNNPNTGMRTFTARVKNGSMTLDLTSFGNDDLEFLTENIGNTIKATKIEIVYYTLPTIEHLTFTPNKVQLGTKQDVAITVDNGYILTGGKLYFRNINTGQQKTVGTLNGNILTVDLTGLTKNVLSSIKSTLTVEEKPKDKFIIQLPNHVTTNLNDLTITYGDTINNLIFRADLDNDWEFDERKSNLGLNVNGKSLGTVTVENNTNYSRVTQSNIDTSVLSENEFKNLSLDLHVHNKYFTDDKGGVIPLNLQLLHATSDTTELLENSTTTITLTADDGYAFKQDIIYSSWNLNILEYSQQKQAKTNSKTIQVTIYTGALHYYNKNDKRFYPYIIASATETSDNHETGTKQINLYKVNDETLNDLSKKVVKEWSNNDYDNYDYTRFIKNLYRLPIEIPTDIQTTTNKIYVGNTSLNEVTTLLNNDNFDLNIGAIKVPLIYNNSNDYKAVSVTLHLPFIKEINLDINDVVNTTLKIKYHIDLLSGDITVIVNNDNGLVYSQQHNITTTLSIYNISNDKTVNNLNSTFINDIKKGYLTLIYKKPILDLQAYATNEHGTLKNYKGFTRVSHGTLKGSYTPSEQTAILNYLRNGVVINEP